MTWREKFVVHVLLLVARMLADDPVFATEIKNLSNNIAVHAPKLEAVS